MPLLFAGVIVVLVIVIIFCLVQIVIMNFPWGKNEISDATKGPLPLYNAKESSIRRIAVLGFQSLGVLDVRLFWQRHLSSLIWYYIDGSATTCAAVSNYKGKNTEVMVTFTSWFPDNALIETLHPIGENIDEPAYSAHFVKEDLERGYRYHQEVIQRWAARHGEPVVIHDVKQLIPLDTVDRTHHRRRRYQRLSKYLVVIITLSTISIATLLYTLTFDLSAINLFQILNQLLLPTILLLICFLGVVFVTYKTVNPPGAIDANTNP